MDNDNVKSMDLARFHNAKSAADTPLRSAVVAALDAIDNDPDAVGVIVCTVYNDGSISHTMGGAAMDFRYAAVGLLEAVKKQIWEA